MIDQFFIAVFGVTAIVLSQSKDFVVRKWSSVFGLLGQPFWFYSAYTTAQWGIFILCFFYLGAWMYGFYNHWVKGKFG